MKRLDAGRLDTIALKWAYGNKKLSEKNVDCFKSGFKTAESIIFSEPIKDVLNDILSKFNTYINKKEMDFEYAKISYYNPNKNDYNKVVEAKTHIKEVIKLLEDMIDEELVLDGSVIKK